MFKNYSDRENRKSSLRRRLLNDTKTKLIEAHAKVIATIDSCETFEQLDSACNLADNFRVLCLAWIGQLGRRKDALEYSVYATDLLNDVVSRIGHRQAVMKQLEADIADAPVQIVGFNDCQYEEDSLIVE